MKKLLRIGAVADSGAFIGVQMDMTSVVATPVAPLAQKLEREDLVTFELSKDGASDFKSLTCMSEFKAQVEALDVPISNAVLTFLNIASKSHALVRIGSITIDPRERSAALMVMQHLQR